MQDEQERRDDLARMKRNASGLLVVVTLAWLALVVLTDDTGLAGYAVATAEAAMVGGLADWFAVTAIFRHPLNIPIPHTAVVASRKDQFGVTLGTFIQENFLSSEVVGARLAELDVSARAGRWLADPDNAATAARHAAELVDRLAQRTTDDDIISWAEGNIRARVEATSAAPLVARTLRLLTTRGHHEELLDELLALLDGFLVANRARLADAFTAESPWWLPEPLDDALFARLFDGIRNLLSDAATPGGPGGLREEIHAGIERLVESLETDPELAERADEVKMELLDNRELRRWVGAMWVEVKDRLRAQALDDSSQLRARLTEVITEWGTRLVEEESLRRSVNAFVQRAGAGAVEQFSPEISGLVSTTVSRWNSEETADRLELLLGRDLQFIRINGTVVGGIAGLVIHTIADLAG